MESMMICCLVSFGISILHPQSRILNPFKPVLLRNGQPDFHPEFHAVLILLDPYFLNTLQTRHSPEADEKFTKIQKITLESSINQKKLLLTAQSIQVRRSSDHIDMGLLRLLSDNRGHCIYLRP